MKQFCIFVSVFLVFGGVFSAHAQDMIVLLNGNIIEAKVMEIHPTDIRYKRIDNLNGPVIIIPKDSVLSIKYENGLLEIINAPPSTGNERGQTERAGTNNEVSVTKNQQSGMPMQMQTILNALPAIPIAGNNLKFQFDNDKWTATVNGENFSAGTIEREDTNDGSILTLKQTHIWPGTAGKTAGRVANMIPGGGAVGSALNTAGSIAGAAGAVEAAGPVIILEYKAGPPARLSLLRSTTTTAAASDNRATTDKRAASENRITNDHPRYAENRFDLDDFSVFAISITGMPTFWWSYGFGLTLTLFEKYKPNEFFSPSYFLSGKMSSFALQNNTYSHEYGSGIVFALGAGVTFKHRFPENKVLWNLGASLEFMWANGYIESDFTYTYTDNSNYWYPEERTGYGNVILSGGSFLLGIGIQTGFSFRFNPYTSLEINGLVKFPFGTVYINQVDYYNDYEYININDINITSNLNMPAERSFWPVTGGIEIGLTFWFPYRSK